MSDSPTGADKIQSSPIFDGLLEEIGRLMEWEPVNDADKVSAGAVRQFLDELPEVTSLLGEVLHHVAEKITEVVGQEEAGPDVLHQVGTYVAAVSEPLGEVAVDWDAVHQASVDRITDDDEKHAAWDWERHHA